MTYEQLLHRTITVLSFIIGWLVADRVKRATMHDDSTSFDTLPTDMQRLLIEQSNLLVRANELLDAVVDHAPAEQRGYIVEWLRDYINS